MEIWDEGKTVRGSPGGKPKTCKHDPKFITSLPWGGSGEKPPTAWFGVSALP